MRTWSNRRQPFVSPFEWNKSCDLGRLYAAGTGFILGCDPDTLRAPDVAFLRTERVPKTPLPGFYEGAPDFAAEVVSPGDRESEIAEKVGHWLDAGTAEVWVAWPRTRSVTVHRPDAEPLLFHGGDTVTAGEVLANFTATVDDIFA